MHFLERVHWGVANGHIVSCLQEAGKKLDIAQVMFCASRKSKDVKALKEALPIHSYSKRKAVESTGLLLNGQGTQRQKAQKQMMSMLSLTGSLLPGSVLRLSSSCTLCQSLGA